MQLTDIMTRHVECIAPEASLVDAAERMRDLNVGSLPVCGPDDRLIGLVTDRDITIRGTAAGLDPKTTRVADVLTPEVNYCFDDQTAEVAARIMEAKQIRRLLVLNRAKRLVGIVSLGDLAVRGEDQQLAGEALEQISEPVGPLR